MTNRIGASGGRSDRSDAATNIPIPDNASPDVLIMKRRDLLRVLAGFAMWPSHSREAHAKPIIGFLISRSRDDSARILAGFRRGLAEAGYVDGLDVGIDYRWADGDYEKQPALAADIVRQKPSVLIAAGGEPSAMAARAASDGIPIVFSVGGMTRSKAVSSTA